jgi:hypothetical protein
MTQPGPLVDWTDGAKVLRVSGKASRIRVPIALLNHGGETLHLATALVQGLHHHLLRQQLPDVTLPLGLSVRPHMAAGSSVRLRLDPSTPAGIYRGDIGVGGQLRPLEITIVEDIALDITPDPLVIAADLGATQRKTVLLRNRGNVALHIDMTGSYPLGEEQPLASADTGSAVEKLIDRFRPPATPPLTPAGEIRIAMDDPVSVLQPGTEHVFRLSITLPSELRPEARYRATVPLYQADVRVIVVTAVKSAKPPSRTKGAST